jgi:hypothetical protein
MTETLHGVDFEGETKVVFDDDLSEAEEFFAEAMRLTHIVNVEDNRARWIQTAQALFVSMSEVTSQNLVDFCRVNGYGVKALCGYVWIPKHNPDKYDACEACVEEARRRINE